MPVLQYRDQGSFHFYWKECVVKRMSGNSRRRSAQKQYRSSISRAAWPADSQYCIATSKAAQRRRIIIMKGWWWACYLIAKLRLHSLHKTALTRQQLITALMTSGIVVTALALYQWYAWPFLAIICTITCAILLLLLAEEHSSPMAHQPDPPVTHEEQIQQMPLFQFPETPVPSTPLIRVMETIDLSSSDVEHFIRQTTEHQTPDQSAIIDHQTNAYQQQDIPMND